MFFIKSLSTAAIALAVAVSGAGLAPSKAQAQAAGTQFIGQMMIVGFNFCPRDWVLANGQLIAISSNEALFSLLGTTYGGDGRTTFALPDLRGRTALHVGTGPGLQPVVQGARGGTQTHTLTVPEMPSHNHIVNATNARADKHGPGTDYLATAYYQDGSELNIYGEAPAAANARQMDPTVITHTGGGTSFDNRDPYLGMYWCIAQTGIFPSRN